MTESSIAEKIREKKKAFLAREQEIVESAKSLLIDHHVDKITVAEIAKKASIGKGTIYKHFQTKNEILVRIMLDYEKGISVELKKGLDRAKEGDPGAVSKAYFESRLANPADDSLLHRRPSGYPLSRLARLEMGARRSPCSTVHRLRRRVCAPQDTETLPASNFVCEFGEPSQAPS